jgi:serine/threonine protein kinase
MPVTVVEADVAAVARPEAMPEAPLPVIAGHEILGELGRGGMGVVYKARQLKLNRLVALKMILAGSHAGSEQLERFLTEARAVARIQHPNIVQIYEIGEQGGLPYFALEYVEGGSLHQKLRGQPQPPRQAAELVRTLAQAIHFAHQRGIIHRDLKPANVLLSAECRVRSAENKGGPALSTQQSALGTPKITDFGLAKRLDSDSEQTASGAVMGTPNYMAPEQAAGHSRTIQPAADVYALGAILYEMLTGSPPFRGGNAGGHHAPGAL